MNINILLKDNDEVFLMQPNDNNKY
jgi:hypothetical protein